MKNILIILFGLFYSHQSLSQTNPVDSLEEVTVTATRFPENKRNLVQKVEIINRQRITRLNTQNTGDLLQATGNVFVQKSQQGGGSPVIRGFEASRVLLVIDGVRMNNAIYRTGHLQNLITVDQNMLDRAELLYGPASTLHGSDALGGVVSLATLSPNLAAAGSQNTLIKGAGFARFSSANDEQTIHLHTSVGEPKIAALFSATYSNFGDMRMGRHFPEDYPNFGRRLQYIDRFQNTDSVFTNTHPLRQKFSGYKQWDLMAKILFTPTEKTRHTAMVQHSNTNHVPRYDRLQDIRNGNLRFAEWYYGPQTRNLFWYRFEQDLPGFFSQVKATTSYQDICESRHQREFRQTGLQNRFEQVKVGGLTLDFVRKKAQHELQTGVDMQWNHVQSSAFNLDISSLEKTSLDTRYPEKNTFNAYGIYIQHLYKSSNKKWILNDGIRLQSNYLRSQVLDSVTAFRPFTNLKQNSVGLSGNLGLVFLPSKNWRFTGGVATGFRAPNVDDLTKIFESSTSNRILVVPNEHLNPEQTISPELSIEWSPRPRLKLQATAYYTWFTDAIVVAPKPIHGSDSILYHGLNYYAVSPQNVAMANIWGYHLAATIPINNRFSFSSTYNFTKGRYRQPGKAESPLDHIPPNFGRTSLSFENKHLLIEAWSLYNGWKRLKDYSPSGEDNLQYATIDGMPGWYTLNLRSSLTLPGDVALQLALENLLDKNYRVFASGFSAPGRNVILTLRANF